MGGTKLCSRRLLQEIIYCVGGVSVFFPLLVHFDDAVVQSGESAASDELAGQVLELVASVLDGNIANQQQMHLLSGFSILGFLFQSVSPQLLNFKTLSASKYMFTVLKNSGAPSLPLSLPLIFLFVWKGVYKQLICFFRHVRSSIERCSFSVLLESTYLGICNL